jgi:hypothetical protein
MRARYAAILLLVPALLAGCGDSKKDTSPQAKTFCSVADPVNKLGGVLESEDPSAIKTAFQNADAALAKVSGDPPQAIAADIATIKMVFSAANDALKQANYDVGAVPKSSSASINALEDPTFTSAGQRVATWTKTNC